MWRHALFGRETGALFSDGAAYGTSGDFDFYCNGLILHVRLTGYPLIQIGENGVVIGVDRVAVAVIF